MGNRRTFIQQILGAAVVAGMPRWAGAFVHPLDEPALRNRLAARSPLLAVTGAGRRLVAVGYRGLVVYSDNEGRTWTQASVPVSADLVAVTFPTEKLGWAVGHGGVVLHTADGGSRWTKQFDGRQAVELAVKTFEGRLAEGPAIKRLLADERAFKEAGGTQPFLALHFENERVGYVVGAFNRIFRTENGGSTWVPWMDRTDNPDGLHFNAMAGRDGNVYLAGEQGNVWRRDTASGRFVPVPSGYSGTLFGLLPLSATTVLTYGMRGSVFRSADAGGTWQRIPMSSLAGVTSGALLPDGTVVLVTQAGGMEISRDQGRSFRPAKPKTPMPYYGVFPGAGGQVILAGAEGMRSEIVALDSHTQPAGQRHSTGREAT